MNSYCPKIDCVSIARYRNVNAGNVFSRYYTFRRAVMCDLHFYPWRFSISISLFLGNSRLYSEIANIVEIRRNYCAKEESN